MIADDSPNDVSGFTRTVAPQIQLDSLGAIPLGDASGTSPLEVSQAFIAGNRVYVLDGAAERVSGYDRNGRLMFAVKYRTSELPVRNPIRLRALDGHLAVIDVDGSGRMALLSPDGELRRVISFSETGSTSVDALLVDGHTAVATIVDVKDLRTGRGTIVTVLDSAGQVAGRGCQADPIYRKSLQRSGLARYYRGFGLAVQGTTIFCRQPVSPAVQILDSRGNTIGMLRRAPPFYRGPVDRRGPMNQYENARFRSTWNEHVDFHATPTGFVSVYSILEAVSGGSRYDLFGCDSIGGALRCATAVAQGRPLTMIPPDTIVILAPLQHATDTPALILSKFKP